MRAQGPAPALALPVALALDELLGEPPVRWHPVVAMGAYLTRAGRLVPAAPPARARLVGGLAWAGGAAVVTGVGLAVDRLARRLPAPAGVLLQGAVLWTALSGRLLRREVADVERALARSLPEGREQVSRLVSRDATVLDAAQVREAALGSLSENLSDSVVAPLLAHAVGGTPAALLYRYVNTADAMWGYRTARWRHAGTVAARADDLANLAAARLSGVLLLLAAGRPGLLRRLPGQARLTASPNGGWPMGALALALDVRLGKPGVYALNPDGPAPTAAATDRALRLSRRVTALVLPVALAVAAARACAGPRR